MNERNETVPPDLLDQVERGVGRPAPKRAGLAARIGSWYRALFASGPVSPAQAPDECSECRMAQAMLSRGFHSVHCNTCGCHWLSLEAANTATVGTRNRCGRKGQTMEADRVECHGAVAGQVERVVRPVAEARKTVRLECRLCGGRYTATLPWQGRPQGPQCQCNPNTWGNWKRVDTGALREGCNYMATAGSVCNKCGRVHEAPNVRANLDPTARRNR
jgi:hypothetical protein